MARDYWYCEVCKGNFDHGEKCDCNRYNKIEDLLIIGMDNNYKEDMMCICVSRQVGNCTTILKTFHNEEAKELYDKITGGK